MEGILPERGQSIILVTIVLMALFVFAAVAVDGARLYALRRQMQNAADAGALAGAYQTCSEGPRGQIIYRATAEAARFARLNEAQAVDVTVNLKKNTVGVVASITFPTFFAGLVGIPELSIQARATAMCQEYETRLVE